MRLGTRGSALALAQARLVAELLGGAELVMLTTSGDRAAGSSVAGDKSRWVDAIEEALLAGEIDLAVHSAKDLPGELAAGLELLGAPTRELAADVLCGGPASWGNLEELAPGARIGTSSVRRAAQLRAAREDLEIVSMRGNVDTRLRKLEDQRLDAIVLAGAGLRRLGRAEEIGATLDPARFVPSPGQGTLALEGRLRDTQVRAAVRSITDERSFACLRAERTVARALEASCNTPLGAHALDVGGGRLRLRAWVGLPDGSAWVDDELMGDACDPERLGHHVAERLLSVGAGELLRRAEELAGEHV